MLKKLKEFIICYWIYGGISREDYDENKDAVLKRNKETLAPASAVTTLMFAGLLLSSFFLEATSDARSCYIVMFLLALFVLIMSLTAAKHKSELVILMWYILLSGLGLYGVLLNTVVGPELSATTICVFMVAGPLLIIDRPVRVLSFMMALAVAFVLCAINTKTPDLAFADSVNVICCLLMGMTIYVCMNHVRLRELVQARHLRHERDTDRLTGLLNKSAAEDIIRRQLKSMSEKSALIVMDIDDFKSFNDTYGHAFGDVILNRTAGCIASVFGESAICSRFGGDEFVIYLAETSERALALMLDGLEETLKRDIVMPCQDIYVAVSAGAAFSMRHGNSYEELFKSADTALYAAKKAGKDRYMIY